MRGSVRRHGKGWQWRARMADGRVVTKAGFRTKTEAEEALGKALAKLADGQYVAPDRLTVETFLEDIWLPAIKATVAPTTYANYKTHVSRHLLPHIGHLAVQKLNEAHLIAVYGELAESGNCRGKREDDEGNPLPPRGLSPKSIRHIHTTLHRALSDAVEWRYIARNPAAGKRAKPPKVSNGPKMKTWTAEELHLFLAGVSDDRLFPLWRFLAMTGVRRGEALGLRWQDVDLKAGTASIVQARTARGFSTPKTERGRRSLELDPETATILRQWRRDQIEERMEWGECWTDTGLVFTREDGNGHHPDGITGIFERLQAQHNERETKAAKAERRQAAPLPRIRLHDLRHTHASLLLANGEHPKVVSERLGHASVAFTLSVYAHVLPGLQKEAVSRLASLVDG